MYRKKPVRSEPVSLRECIQLGKGFMALGILPAWGFSGVWGSSVVSRGATGHPTCTAFLTGGNDFLKYPYAAVLTGSGKIAAR